MPRCRIPDIPIPAAIVSRNEGAYRAYLSCLLSTIVEPSSEYGHINLKLPPSISNWDIRATLIPIDRFVSLADTIFCANDYR